MVNFEIVSDRLLNDKQLPVEVRVKILNILAMAALKDDIILVLHTDRKDHILMNYAYEIDRLSREEQEALSLFVSIFSKIFFCFYLLIVMNIFHLRNPAQSDKYDATYKNTKTYIYNFNS